MADIFLSYNREDHEAARRFADAFAAEGLDVWWDVTLRSGEAYDEVTEAALKSARAVVVLWSQRSVVSRWVRAEATLADRNRTLVPVMIEPCERPVMFELTQTADLSHWRGETDDGAWRALAADVRRFVEREAPPKPASPSTAARPASPAVGRVRGGAPSLAILPFANRSGLAEDEVFAFGMVEDIIEAMSRGVEVRVISSSAIAGRVNGGAVDLDALVRQLDVRFVLEGNVRRIGPSLRVTTQLVEAAHGEVLWSGRFDRPLDRLASLQEDLVVEVAARLRTQSHRLEIERALRKPGDLTAWEAVWRSVAALRSMTPASLLLAIAEATKAVEIAPDYGLALATLAQAQSILYYSAFPDNEAEVRRIRALADEAIRLEPDNSLVLSTASNALSCLGFADEALSAAMRSIRLNPANQFGHFSCGVACTLLDRSDEAAAHFARELEIAPDHPMVWTSYLWQHCARLRAGLWQAALEVCDTGLELAPDNAPLQLNRAVCCRELGRPEEAATAMAVGRRLEPDTPFFVWELRYRRSLAGSPTAEAVMSHFHALWAQTDPPA
jgi:TolB-like protein/Flp pilus assembly protein TadD